MKRRKYKEVDKRRICIILPVSLHDLVKEKNVNFSLLIEQLLHNYLLDDCQKEFLDKEQKNE